MSDESALTVREEPLVRVEKLGRIYDVSQPWLNRIIERTPRRLLMAAADVSFAIDRKETFALVGESGSGKSTVAKMVVGLVPPSAGEVFIDGISMVSRRQRRQRQKLRRRIQMIFQDPYASLNPRWRASDIIAEPLRAFGLIDGRRAQGERIDELLRLVGLDPADGQKYPHEFSGGQRQRIAIARALSSQPEFIVCDEPSSALDVSVQAQILNLMRDLQAQFGLTYLFISHNLAVVRHMADRIGVMYLGRLVEIAPARELFRNPRHPYTQMLLDAIPDIDMTGRARATAEGEIPNPLAPPRGCPFHPRCPHAFERCRGERPQLLGARLALVACHAVEEGRINPIVSATIPPDVVEASTPPFAQTMLPPTQEPAPASPPVTPPPPTAPPPATASPRATLGYGQWPITFTAVAKAVPPPPQTLPASAKSIPAPPEAETPRDT